jgi:hypothetical protein
MKEKDFPSATGVLLIGALLLIASAGGLQAQGGNQPVFSSGFQRGVAGLYVGTLDFTPLGIPSLEPIALRLDQLGGAILVSFHEETERESATIGIWENVGGGRLGLGIIMYRRGTAACSVITAPDGAADDTCVLRIGATLSRDGDDGLVGSIVLTFEEVDATTGDTVQVITPPLPTVFERQTLADFELP